MAADTRPALLSWTVVLPAVAFVALLLTWGRDLPWPAVAVVAAPLVATLRRHTAVFQAEGTGGARWPPSPPWPR